MGIQGLMVFIKKRFPQVVRRVDIKNQYKNKTLAIDVSNWIYQFLIKTQTLKGGNISIPTDSLGNHTGHLIGMMSRATYCAQNNINTVWVFDGKPPKAKSQQLKKRKSMKEEAQQKMQAARQQGLVYDLLAQSKRTTHITKAQKDDAQTLIKLIGLPVIQSPSEAQPQCAQLVKSGLAYGVISQDTDVMTFGCPRTIRKFSAPQDCVQVQLQLLLKQLQLTYDQFVDFCILCGCDYTGGIKNIGPVKAHTFIKQYKTIDQLLQQIIQNDKMYKRYQISQQFNHLIARQLFKNPQVLKITQQQVKVNKLQQDQLIQFLKQRQFSQNRINNWLKRMKATDFYKQYLV